VLCGEKTRIIGRGGDEWRGGKERIVAFSDSRRGETNWWREQLKLPRPHENGGGSQVSKNGEVKRRKEGEPTGPAHGRKGSVGRGKGKKGRRPGEVTSGRF